MVGTEMSGREGGWGEARRSGVKGGYSGMHCIREEHIHKDWNTGAISVNLTLERQK